MLNTPVIQTTTLEQFVIALPANSFYQSSLFLFALGLFLLGLLGMIFNARNFLIAMVAVELMYLGAIASFAFYGFLTGDATALSYSLLILILAACESAIGLGLLIVLHRFGQSIRFESYQQLEG